MFKEKQLSFQKLVLLSLISLMKLNCLLGGQNDVLVARVLNIPSLLTDKNKRL